MRRKFSIGCLLLAWLCANGALWNIVQVVAWVKMLHDYSQVMSGVQAVKITFDGSAPCALCKISQHARDAAREQLPREDALGGDAGKILLLSECIPAVVLTAPDFRWPGVADAASPTRTEAVPVPPPRV
ncbi:MAG: hypothetical protein JWQ83_71 [Lacunisphaera sp.]|nr:hypothetical protein [Lacunisphaera sp.]MDB6164931.1 hypothetical protein [Lacunisphaera sp.]